MDAQILNDIVSAFVQAFEAGTATLGQYSLGILAIAATLALSFHMMPQLANGSVGVGDTLGGFLLLVLKIGIMYWLVFFLPDLARAAFDTFAQWGSAVSGGGFTRQQFMSPGEIVDAGFRAARPVHDFTTNIVNYFTNDTTTLVAYNVAYYLIVIGFFWVALNVMMVIIEFHLAVLAGAVLLPWGVFPAMAFWGEFILAWMTSMLVRVLLTAAIVSIGLPLFKSLKFTLSSGGDPTWYSGFVFGGTAFLFALLTWIIPQRAATIAGRGMSLALTGSDLVAGAATGARFAMLGLRLPLAAIRGGSTLLQTLKGP